MIIVRSLVLLPAAVISGGLLLNTTPLRIYLSPIVENAATTRNISIPDDKRHDTGSQLCAHTNNSNHKCPVSCPFPKIIHMIHVSPKLSPQQDPLPNKVTQRVKQYQNFNPDWQIMLWNNSMVHHHYPHLVKLMTNVTFMAWVADLLRYYTIFDFGGVYLDTDFDMFQSLDGICSHGVKNFIVCARAS